MSVPPRITRRDALRWVAVAAAATGTGTWGTGQSADRPPAAASGYGPDPDLQRIYAPGDLWPLSLTARERRTAAILADVIIPEDAHSPAASTVGITDFLDEWISAPYPQQTRDRDLLVPGLARLEVESHRRHGATFDALDPRQRDELCRALAAPEGSGSFPPEFHRFFARFRELVIGGFYTTPAGMKDLGYVGNVPLPAFAGPPLAVLARLGLTAESAPLPD